MTAADAELVARWRYDGDWAVYDVPSAATILDLLPVYFVVEDGTDVIGFLCIGAAARVAGMTEEKDTVDLGVGMRPDLTGRGDGTEFGTVVLRFVEERFPGTAVRAAVQSWNTRSLSLTRSLGFAPLAEHMTSQVRYQIVVRTKRVGPP
jgi:RimJ/RimL family protein N-acetyltransferase